MATEGDGGAGAGAETGGVGIVERLEEVLELAREGRLSSVGVGIVERLEEVLELAREGRLSSVGIAFVLRDGAVNYRTSSGTSRPALIGALARMQHDLCDSFVI